MAAADLVEFEEIQVVNVNNAERFTTYVIPDRPQRVVQLNGAAARLGMPGDLVILIAYGEVEQVGARDFEPAIVFVDEHNRALPPGAAA